MFLHKTGWRIKNLVTHRKNNTTISNTDKDSKSEDIEFKVGKRLSWSSQNATTIDFPLLRRTSSNSITRTPHIAPQPPSKITNSSSSSLCSCNCDLALNRDASLSLPPTRRSPDALYASNPHAKHSKDDKLRRILSSDQRSQAKLDEALPNITSLTTIDTNSTFDLLEALSIDALDNESTPIQIRKHVDGKLDQLSPNVEQLIRETDEAFRAVGAALADTRTSGKGQYDTDFKIAVGHLEPPSIPTKNPRRLEGSTEYLMAIPMADSKLRRKRSGKKKSTLLRPSKPIPPPPANTIARWTLNDVTSNVVDVFSGKKFRMEVDEMLTPDRMEAIKKSIKIEREKRRSIESTTSGDTEGSTPTEPFHLESLSDRITAAQKITQFPPSPARTPPGIPRNPKTLKVQLEDLKDSEMTFNNISFPTPPRTPKRSSGSRVASLLPTIPEISTLTLSTEHVKRSPLYTTHPLQTYFLLPSTRYTLVASLYRQGPIRVERPSPEIKDRLSPEEEPLDWTAFQMAISGMNDGLVNGNGWEEDEIEVEEIMNWWMTYGFPGCGKLEREDPKISILATEIATSSVLKELPVDQNVDGTAQDFSLASRWRRAREEMDTGKIVDRPSDSDFNKRKSLADSMPPSPMLDLILPSTTRNGEVVPMGFNLGHDLGDFLSWEAHHVETLVQEW